MSKWFEDTLLRIDLIGIGVMIFTLTLTLVYNGFHSDEVVRDKIMMAMITICITNGTIQFLPCYGDEKYDWHRTAFYCCLVALCLALAITWSVYYASSVEFQSFALRLFMSFGYLGMGFVFYASKYPEKLYPASRLIQ